MNDSHLSDLMRALNGLPDRERKRRLAQFLCNGLPAANETASELSREPLIRNMLASAFYVADSPTISRRILSQLPSSHEAESPQEEEQKLPPDFRAIPEDRIALMASSIIDQIKPNIQPAPQVEEVPRSSCRLDLARLRYRGDAADVNELVQLYRIGEYLDSYAPFLRQQQLQQREKLLAEGIRLTSRISPRIFGIFERVTLSLDVPAETEIFCLPSAEVNASAILARTDHGATVACIGITSAALELLDDGEIAFLLGHELGHFLFGNHRMNGLICTDPKNPAATILPPLGESIFLRWRKKSELSADRIGLLACGDFHCAARALLKAAFGLSERNINLDVDALVDQIDDLAGNPHMIKAAFSSHPLLPIRLKALQLFSRSAKAADAGFAVANAPIADNELCDAVDHLIKLTRRHPTGHLEVAAMNAVALGGVAVLSADQEISEHEIKILIEILHRHFTDEPDEVVPISAAAIQPALEAALEILRNEAETELKHFIVSRLVDVGMADGALLGREGAVVLQLAEKLGLQPQAAHAIVVGAAQAVGFRMDEKLNRAAADLKKSLSVGLHQGSV